MTNKNQQAIDALTSVTITMLKLWYTDTADLNLGEISRAVERCSEIFQFIDCDETVEVKLITVLQLCETYQIYFR